MNKFVEKRSLQDHQEAAFAAKLPRDNLLDRNGGIDQALAAWPRDASFRSLSTSRRKCSNWIGFIRQRSAPASYILRMLSCSGKAVIARTLIARVSGFSRIERQSD